MSSAAGDCASISVRQKKKKTELWSERGTEQCSFLSLARFKARLLMFYVFPGRATFSVARGHTKMNGTAHTPQSCSERVMFMDMMNELIAHHVAVIKSRRRSAARGTKPRLLRVRRSRVGNNAAIRQPSRQPKRTVGPLV